jgi:hypothetical protein
MKRIVYLTFYFQPDLCAGSFRNSPLAIELAKQAGDRNVIIDLYTTMPNRYSSFEKSAPTIEKIGNLTIHRISLPPHNNGMFGQVFSFRKFYKEVLKLNKNKKNDLLFASSSRLFTAYLGYKIARRSNSILYLDIRDIFVDTISDVLKSKLLKIFLLPFLKIIERKTFNYALHINLISGGFLKYFKNFNKSNFTFFTNGIDDEFLLTSELTILEEMVRTKKTIVYAGNFGEGQGLHKIIPQAAKLLGANFNFLIIGDGGAKKALKKEIDRLNVKNITIQNPINRSELMKVYQNADFLFLHLNDYPAFRKVLPSKIFELATFNKPIIAGVSGFAKEFIESEVSDSFVFDPCNVNQLVAYLKINVPSRIIDRDEFISKYRRSNINKAMAESILSYI